MSVCAYTLYVTENAGPIQGLCEEKKGGMYMNFVAIHVFCICMWTLPVYFCFVNFVWLKLISSYNFLVDFNAKSQNAIWYFTKYSRMWKSNFIHLHVYVDAWALLRKPTATPCSTLQYTATHVNTSAYTHISVRGYKFYTCTCVRGYMCGVAVGLLERPQYENRILYMYTCTWIHVRVYVRE